MTYAVVRELSDVAVGNDKALTNFGVGLPLEVEIMRIELTTTATVGSRSIDIEYRDAADVVLAALTLTPNVTASSTQVWLIYPGSSDGEMPPFTIAPNFDIHVVDTADIDVLDTLEVRAFTKGAGPSAARAG